MSGISFKDQKINNWIRDMTRIENVAQLPFTEMGMDQSFHSAQRIQEWETSWRPQAENRRVGQPQMRWVISTKLPKIVKNGNIRKRELSKQLILYLSVSDYALLCFLAGGMSSGGFFCFGFAFHRVYSVVSCVISSFYVALNKKQIISRTALLSYFKGTQWSFRCFSFLQNCFLYYARGTLPCFLRCFNEVFYHPSTVFRAILKSKIFFNSSQNSSNRFDRVCDLWMNIYHNRRVVVGKVLFLFFQEKSCRYNLYNSTICLLSVHIVWNFLFQIVCMILYKRKLRFVFLKTCVLLNLILFKIRMNY